MVMKQNAGCGGDGFRPILGN